MRQEEIEHLLLEHDVTEKRYRYAPPGFSELSLLMRVENVKEGLKLGLVTDKKLIIKDLGAYQDGPLFTVICIEHGTFDYDGAGLYFSRFGNFCTLYAPENDEWGDSLLMVEDVVKKHDFVLLDSKILSQSYSGGNKYEGVVDWFDRYFAIAF